MPTEIHLGQSLHVEHFYIVTWPAHTNEPPAQSRVLAFIRSLLADSWTLIVQCCGPSHGVIRNVWQFNSNVGSMWPLIISSTDGLYWQIYWRVDALVKWSRMLCWQWRLQNRCLLFENANRMAFTKAASSSDQVTIPSSILLQMNTSQCPAYHAES